MTRRAGGSIAGLERVLVGGVPFSLSFTDPKGDDTLRDLGAAGYTDMDGFKIVIAADRPEVVQRMVLLHEVLHASDGLTAEHSKLISENNTVRLSAMLFGFLSQNPECAEWIARGSEG